MAQSSELVNDHNMQNNLDNTVDDSELSKSNNKNERDETRSKNSNKKNINKRRYDHMPSSPEISLLASKSLKNTLPYEDNTQRYINYVYLMISPLFRLDPVFLWLVFFVMLSLSICKNSVYGLVSAESVACFFLLVFTIAKYILTVKGIIPYISFFDDIESGT